MPRAEREQLILEVAGGIFARDGYHSASMDEIAAGADVSKPMLYAYFGSKEGLYVNYIERAGSELVARLQPTFGDGTVDPSARVDGFLRFVEEHQDGWRVLFTEASASRPVADEVAQLRARVIDAVQRLVRAGLPAGLRCSDDALDAAAHAIVGTGESLANWWLERPEVPRVQLTEWYAAIVLATVTALTRSG